MSPNAADRVVIAHLSDLHLPLPQSIPASELLSKRILGWANAHLVRSRLHRREPCQALLEHLSAQRPDLVVVTGDLTNLSLPAEFEQVDALLGQAGLVPERCLLLPGNHDRYTPGADRGGAFERGMQAWFPADLRRDGWPLVLSLGPVLIAGLDTAVWRGPLRAAGQLDPLQLARLEQLAGQARTEDRHLVAALHHPPFRLDGPLLHHYRAGLEGVERLEPLMARQPISLLCGHLHRLVRRRLGQAEAFCVPSASADAGRSDEQLAYHLYTFSARGLVEASAVRHWPARRRPFVQERLPAPG